MEDNSSVSKHWNSSLSPDKDRLLLSNHEGYMITYILRELRQGPTIGAPRRIQNELVSSLFLNYGKHICGSRQGHLQIWDTNLQAVSQTLGFDESSVNALETLCINGTEFVAEASNGRNPKISIWSAILRPKSILERVHDL
ncbi:hypothetical protein BDQ17DRAFT_1437822 [Cyathus striatus]|nr:hypothetical protein BDQ17DRAFT_1437822 [Cyathus striatus]